MKSPRSISNASYRYQNWQRTLLEQSDRKRDQIEECREIAPHHFMGVGSTWSQFGNPDKILDHAFDMMRKGADMYYTLRSYEVMEMLAKEGIPVQSHIGLIPTFNH